MYPKPVCLFFTIILINLLLKAESRFEFTNLVCSTLDKKFGEFEYCHIKSVNRSYKYVSGKLKLYKLPMTKLMINVALWKRSNGYKPFLYNFTFDVCALLRNTKFNPIGQVIHDIQTHYTSLNESCPIKHDITLKKLPIDFLDKSLSKLLPFSEGTTLAGYIGCILSIVQLWVRFMDL